MKTKSEFFNESFKIICDELVNLKNNPTDEKMEEVAGVIYNILDYIFKKTEGKQ
jgi:hypothetical protein